MYLVTLKEFDPVMVSDDGDVWEVRKYKEENKCHSPYDSSFSYWKYIVPPSDFDFNDLESNIKRSIV